MKALILSFLEPEKQGSGIIMGASRLPSLNFLVPFLSKVVEAKCVRLMKSKLIDQA